MKVLKWIGIVVGVAVALFVIVGLLLPGRYRVERSVVIDAPPETIHPTISTLKEWPTWTAWTVEKYPDMKVTFTGPESGVGAHYAWEGESTGKGKLMLTKSDPATGVEYDMDFDDGKYVSTGGIKLEPDGAATKATWWNAGELGWNPINRYFGLMMDGMMGPDFQTGLNNLKQKVEAKQDQPAEAKAAENDVGARGPNPAATTEDGKANRER